MIGQCRRNFLVRALVALIVATVSNGCVTTPEPAPSISSARPVGAEFRRALRDCRVKQPGRMNKRMHRSPTSPAVASCLERRGWLPDGSPISPSEGGGSPGGADGSKQSCETLGLLLGVEQPARA